MLTKHEQLFEDIYDLIGDSVFKKEAKQNIKKFIKNKNIEWDGDKNIISLGRDFKIKLIKHK